MGYSLLHRLYVKGLASFVLSLLVVIYPAICYSLSQDTTARQDFYSSINETNPSNTRHEESRVQASNDAPDSGRIILTNSPSKVDKNKSAENNQRSPVISFSSQSLTVSEGEDGLYIGVALVESSNSPVEVNVVFYSGSSSATTSDISGYRSQKISFDENEPSGTIKRLRIRITDDEEYEPTETAVFRLQDISAGNTAEPTLFNLTIRDNDTPNVIINEVFADPIEGYGDANGDGFTDSSDDQFVEIVNNEDNPVDLSGWILSSSMQDKFTFPQGTVIPSGKSLVVFGGGTPKGYFGGSQIFVANSLELGTRKGTVELSDEKENVVAEMTYDLERGGGQSITRMDGADNITNLSYRHSEVSESGNVLYSPGKKTDGTSFGSQFAAGIRSGEGWQLISVPTQNTTFNDLFGNFQMRTSLGSDNSSEQATIFEWDLESGGNFRAVTDMSKEMEAGKGYAIYFYEDDNPNLPGVQGGFPKIISTDKAENNSITVPITSSDDDNSQTLSDNEGWNLLGNPFGVDISVDEVLASVNRALQIENPEYKANSNLYTWEPAANGGNGDYIVLERYSGNTIAPFQAFWLRINDVSEGESFTVNVPFERNKLIANTEGRVDKESNKRAFDFELRLGNDQYYDDYSLVFDNEGSIGTDLYDAYKLPPLNTNAISLYSLAGENKLMKNTLPLDINTTVEVPLHFDASGRESLSFNWHGLNKIPDTWQITLLDKKLNKEINLRSVPNYSFTTTNEENNNERIENNGNDVLLNKPKIGSEDSRFILSVSPGIKEQNDSPDIPESVKLNPNYPNPFNPTTTIRFELKEDSEVLLSIWNIVGQRVVTLVDGMKEAGEHTATWNASEMPSGIYIAQLEVDGQVFIRKMTLIK